MTTTPSTASQAPAVSIADDDEFIDLMHALSSVPSSVYAGNEFSKVINYIDAKLAQARQEGYCEGSTVGFKGGEYFYKERATAAEAKLEAVEDAARNLLVYLDRHCWGLVPEGETGDKLRDLVFPAESDESGLPG